MEPGNSICIFPFSLIQRVLWKMAKEKVSKVKLIASAWQTQPWYPIFFGMSFSQPFLLPILPGFLKNPKGKDHSLVIKKSLALVALKVTGKPWLSQAFQNELPILSLNRGEKVHQLTLS